MVGRPSKPQTIDLKFNLILHDSVRPGRLISTGSMTPAAERHLHCPSFRQHQKLLPCQGEVSRRDGGVICNFSATHPVLRTPLQGGEFLTSHKM